MYSQYRLEQIKWWFGKNWSIEKCVHTRSHRCWLTTIRKNEIEFETIAALQSKRWCISVVYSGRQWFGATTILTFEPCSKRMCMQGKHLGKLKIGVIFLLIRLFCPLFFNQERLLLADFKGPSVNISDIHYMDTLYKLHKAIRNKWPGMLSHCDSFAWQCSSICLEHKCRKCMHRKGEKFCHTHFITKISHMIL